MNNGYSVISIIKKELFVVRFHMRNKMVLVYHKIRAHSVQNFISGILYQLIVAVSGFIMPRLIIANYGSVLNGLVSTVTQLVTYLAIVEMGLASASLVALYKPMATRDYITASRVVSAINSFYHRVALFFSVGTLVCGIILPLVIQDDIPVTTIWLVVAAVSGVNLVTYIFLGKYRALLQSDNRLYVSNYVKCLSVVIQLCLSLYIIRLSWNIAFIKFTAIITGMIEFFLLSYYCKRVYPEIKMNVNPQIDAIRQRKDILIHQISALILNNTDVLLLTLFGSTLALVSVYSVYNMVMMILFNVISSLMSSRSAVLAKLYVLGKIDELRTEMYRFERLYYFVVFSLYACMIVFVMPFVRLYTQGVTDINYDIPLIGALFPILGICRVLRGCYAEITNAAGKFKETKIQSINSAIINISISLLLIWKYQIPGLLIGSIIAELYRTVHCMIFFYRQLFPFDWKSLVLRIIINIILIVLTYIIMKQWRDMSFTNYYSAFLIMALVSAVILLLFWMVNCIMDYLIKCLKGRKNTLS